MPFVEVIDRGIRSHRLERAHAADAENDFLLHARLAIAAVQPRRELPIPRRVLFEVGVEQVQLHAPEAHAPDRDEHGAVAERHGRHARLAIGRHRRLDRRVGPGELFVDLFLPAVQRHALTEVPLRIHEPDADERHTEVARFLALIAGEHAETACVDRQRLMQRELRREVRDRPRSDLGAVSLDPRVVRAARCVEPLQCAVVAREPLAIGE